MMKSPSIAEAKSDPMLSARNGTAAQTRKPVKRAFGILKNRFAALQKDLKFHHEGDSSCFCKACIIPRSMSMADGGDGENFLSLDEPAEDEVVSEESAVGKRIRDAIMFYVFDKLGNKCN